MGAEIGGPKQVGVAPQVPLEAVPVEGREIVRRAVVEGPERPIGAQEPPQCTEFAQVPVSVQEADRVEDVVDP